MDKKDAALQRITNNGCSKQRFYNSFIFVAAADKNHWVETAATIGILRNIRNGISSYHIAAIYYK